MSNQPIADQIEFFASCPLGFEQLLSRELRSIAPVKTRPLQGRVQFFSTLKDAYTICLYTRLASRIIYVIKHIDATDAQTLYQQAAEIPWWEHIDRGTTCAIDAHGTNENLNNSIFSAQKVKDALCDACIKTQGWRPSIDTHHPDVMISLRIAKNRATLGIDLSGEPLFKRGWEAQKNTQHHLAFLRPDYAAALLSQSSWYSCVRHEHATLVCAYPQSGTLCIEAVEQALHLACGRNRIHWGFLKWKGHQPDIWENVIDQSKNDEQRYQNHTCTLVLYDDMAAQRKSMQTIRYMLSRAHISAARVNFETVDFDEFIQRYAKFSQGQTIANNSNAPHVASNTSATAFIFNASQTDVSSTAICADRVSKLIQAAQTTCKEHEPSKDSSETLKRSLTVSIPEELAHEAGNALLAQTCTTRLGTQTVLFGNLRPAARELFSCELGGAWSQGRMQDITIFDKGAAQFAARLKKTLKQRESWAKREDVSCYRVYDADLPDFACSIDVFNAYQPRTTKTTTKDRAAQRWLNISEYKAPKVIDPVKAKLRLYDTLHIASLILQTKPEDVFVHTRMQAKGGSQYHMPQTNNARKTVRTRDTSTAALRNANTSAVRNASSSPLCKSGMPEGSHLIEEGGLIFEVNFTARHDCGIFLDFREVRNRVREMAKAMKGSKRFLNLFAYTATSTCYAADGGANYTTTVDMSAPTLQWAQRNMERNGFKGNQHEYIRADVLTWIQDMRHSKNRWDLILCDVPTFSNSNKMHGKTWDVARDHVELIITLSRLLTRDGKALFCCNLKHFTLNKEALAKAGVAIRDITADTIPFDFARTQNVHHAYIVTRG